MEKVVGIKQLSASKHEVRLKNYPAVPQWVVVMYNTVFFRTCITHPDSRMDRFCADCYSSLCSNCLPAHARHKHVKIRRYIYSDVINRQDLSKLFNCSGIQTYVTNKARVLFLKQRNHYHRHQQQQINFKDYRCIICHRSLQDNCSHYCSIECKVTAIYGGECRKDQYRIQHLKRRKLKQSRKGVPLRAPMF
ncbi:hypothetical protein BDE02_10G095300 [Populus trichocarpa]|nr:hypothetical protein BDE02_10G095300 [Populus trichocarpa]